MDKHEFTSRLFESELSSSAKLVLFAILQYMNQKTRVCYPSMETLGADCSMARNTVASAVKEASEAGFVTVGKIRPKRAKFTVNTYTFDFDCTKFEQSVDQSNERSTIAHEPNEPKELQFKEKTSFFKFSGEGFHGVVINWPANKFSQIFQTYCYDGNEPRLRRALEGHDKWLYNQPYAKKQDWELETCKWLRRNMKEKAA